MVFARMPMATSPGRVLMTISVVVVPDGADVARIGLEEQTRGSEDTPSGRFANRTGVRIARLVHWALALVPRVALLAEVIVFRHQGSGHGRTGGGFELAAAVRAPPEERQVIDRDRKAVTRLGGRADRRDQLVADLQHVTA